MENHEPYRDSLITLATWDSNVFEWKMQIELPSGRLVEASVDPAEPEHHFGSIELKESRECIHWVCNNESKLLDYVCLHMFELAQDWHDSEWGSEPTEAEFKSKISLRAIQVMEDHRAALIFDDGEFFGGHAITFCVGADGVLNEEPYLWG